MADSSAFHPKCIFGCASVQSRIWQPSIRQMALLFLLWRPVGTLNKQNLYTSNRLICVVFPNSPLSPLYCHHHPRINTARHLSLFHSPSHISTLTISFRYFFTFSNIFKYKSQDTSSMLKGYAEISMNRCLPVLPRNRRGVQFQIHRCVFRRGVGVVCVYLPLASIALQS